MGFEPLPTLPCADQKSYSHTKVGCSQVHLKGSLHYKHSHLNRCRIKKRIINLLEFDSKGHSLVPSRLVMRAMCEELSRVNEVRNRASFTALIVKRTDAKEACIPLAGYQLYARQAWGERSFPLWKSGTRNEHSLSRHQKWTSDSTNVCLHYAEVLDAETQRRGLFCFQFEL